MRFRLKVIKGQGRGKQLGFPTLNFALPPGLERAQGIYAGWVWVGEVRHKAAIHLGPVPTFNQTEVSFEAHLLDAAFSALPSEVDVELVERLRDIAFFKTPEELTQKITEDVARTNQILDRKSVDEQSISY